MLGVEQDRDEHGRVLPRARRAPQQLRTQWPRERAGAHEPVHLRKEARREGGRRGREARREGGGRRGEKEGEEKGGENGEKENGE